MPYKELYDYDQAAEFVADYLTYEVLHTPNKLVNTHVIYMSVTQPLLQYINMATFCFLILYHNVIIVLCVTTAREIGFANTSVETAKGK